MRRRDASSRGHRSIASATSTSSTFHGDAFSASRLRVMSALSQEYDGEPNGLKIHKDGRVFIADYRNGIMLLDPSSGSVTPFVEHAPV